MATEVEEATHMVNSLRVTDLQTLLRIMGHSKRGLKGELVERALALVRKECSHELILNIRELYGVRLHGLKDPVIGRPKPAPAPAHTEVKLTPLPFYQILETLLPPTELIPPPAVAQGSNKLHYTLCAFDLTPNCRELHPCSKFLQVVLRICYTDTSSVQEDQYPPNFALQVNGSDCDIPGCNRYSVSSGVEPRRPCRPINITPWLKLSTANRAMVTWGNIGKRYSVGVYLVQVFTASELFSQMQNSVESAERCRQRIQEKLRFDPDPESEITTTGLRVSLICPLVKMRLGAPCRGFSCAHLQCFDAVFFLQMNEKKPTWTCPVCDKPTPFELLTIDGLLLEILKETEDVEEIEFLADGSWRPIRADQKSTPECPLLDISSPVVSSLSQRAAVGAVCGPQRGGLCWN
ncbi:hypothetical protein AAFF_G00299680 [Aldrovandia affinis]|uniref:E3 SUMO-protein ligase PIAS4 n=1 Tax=Aldrovandia affinis TaxID=143900 RepID=A0AAD7R8K3_9TELE|nr:hypothetical protein AAFF_G00299680 [Aldrovandia affinis]